MTESGRNGRGPTRRTAILAAIAFAASALTASEAGPTAAPSSPRITAIAWAVCNYGLESPPMPPLIALVMTSDGVMIGTRARSTVFDDQRAESTVIGPQRFREIAERIDHSTLFDPPPKPSGTGFAPQATDPTDVRLSRFAVRRDGEWTDWSTYRDYTNAEKAVVEAAYAVTSDPKLVWRPAPRRANAFAVCRWGSPREAMIQPASASSSMWGVSEIVVAECRRGPDVPGASPSRAYQFLRFGSVARTTADEGDQLTANRTEYARLGDKVFDGFAARLEQSGFFAAHGAHGRLAVAGTRGTRLSALRDDQRTTWDSERDTSRGNQAGIIAAMLAAANDPGLTWSSVPRDPRAFEVCTP